MKRGPSMARPCGFLVCFDTNYVLRGRLLCSMAAMSTNIHSDLTGQAAYDQT